MKTLLAFLLLLPLAIPMTSCVSNDHHDDRHEISITRQSESDHPRRHSVPPARAVYELP